jgi:hypothetical protein
MISSGVERDARCDEHWRQYIRTQHTKYTVSYSELTKIIVLLIKTATLLSTVPKKNEILKKQQRASKQARSPNLSQMQRTANEKWLN